MNKIVYSFWKAPLEHRWEKYSKGLELEDILQSSINCLYLSVLYAKKLGFEIEIVTDVDSESYFKDLPIDAISTDLTFLTYSGSCWVEGKMWAISKQTKPFVHLDWDVMLRKEEVASIIKNCNADFIVQSIDDIISSEVPISGVGVHEGHLENFKWVVDNSPFYIEGLSRSHRRVYNTAILGFNNLQLRDEYIQNFLMCLRINGDDYVYKSFDDISRMIDQYLMYCLADSKKIIPQVLFPNKENIQAEAKRIGYTHLTFLNKYTKPVQEQLIATLKKEFPEYSFLVDSKVSKDNKIKISLCTVVMNRLDHLITTLKHNLAIVKTFDGVVDINIIDYNSTDGLEEYLFAQEWFIEALEKGWIIYYKNYTAEYYHRSLPKNVVHLLALGEYVINIDADNFISNAYLHYCLHVARYKKNFFLRPSILCNRGAYGRIMINRNDFRKIGGYNLKISNYGYEDTELSLRLRKMGITQLQAPAHLFSDVIEHDDELRIANEKRDAKNSSGIHPIAESDFQNKKINFELYPNKDKTINLELFKLNHNKKKTKVYDASTITLD